MAMALFRAITWAAGVAAVLSLATAAGAARAATVTIGTGGQGGVYFPAGRAICRLVNEAGTVRCQAVPTQGSVYNVGALRAGKLQLAVVQSDSQYYGYQGEAKFKKDGPFKGMRALFSLHTEPFTVVARADSGVYRFRDLAGKRVNVSNPGSGARATMIQVMQAMGWRGRTFSQVTQLDTDAQAKALCANEIDVMVYTVGHPSATIREATGRCGARLISVDEPEIDKLIKSRAYYSKAWIPAGLYKNNTRRIGTFGVSATVVATARLDTESAYAVVNAVFDNLGKFRTLHPALKTLSDRAMANDGLSAPLHPGAEKYFMEAGLR